MIEQTDGAPQQFSVFLEERSYDIKLRSELAQEIISRKPRFAEKWAMVIFLGALLLPLIIAWFMKYPDIIESNATLTSNGAPKEIVIRQEGRLVRLFAHNNEQVSSGKVLGWMESTADHEDVLELSGRLDSSVHLLDYSQPEAIAALFRHRYDNLGEIQQDYKTFSVSLQTFKDYMVNGFYARRKQMLDNDIQALNDERKILQSQEELTKQDLKLAEESYNMNKQLLSEKVLSSEDFRQEQSKFINKQMTVHQLDATLFTNEMQQREKNKELDQLEHDISQQKAIFSQALQVLKSSVDAWKRKFILESPLNGTVSFIIPLQENQFLQQGKLVGYINPNDNLYFAETNLQQSNFGKIDTGLKVQLRFDAYPYQEVGYVDGTLSYVSNVPSDSGFLATIRLDRGLVTNNRVPIKFKSGLKAKAIVITQNMRLLQKFFSNFVLATSVGK